MRVDVTAEDIEKGKRRDASQCPVALALSRTAGGLWFVSDDAWESGTGLERDLPNEVHQFIDDFDAGLPAEPFSFEFPDSERRRVG